MAPPSVQFQFHHLYCNFLTVDTTPRARCINEVYIPNLCTHLFIHINEYLQSMLVFMTFHCIYLAPDNLFSYRQKKIAFFAF